MQILLALLEAPGEVVTREALRARLWGAETFVDFNQSLNSAVRRLRQALEDDPHDPVYIETIPRVGYRLISETSAFGLETADFFETGTRTELFPNCAPAPAQWWKGSWTGIASWINPVAAIWALVALAGSALIVGQLRLNSHPLQKSQTPPPTIKRGQPAAVIVLPFRNLTGNKDNELLVDGITDAVTTKLAEQPGLRVAPGYPPAQLVHGKLMSGIDSQQATNSPVLEGAVHRRRDQVWITTRLFDPKNRTYLWATTYTEQASDLRSNEIVVAEDVARHVDSQLATDLASQKTGK